MKPWPTWAQRIPWTNWKTDSQNSNIIVSIKLIVQQLNLRINQFYAAKGEDALNCELDSLKKQTNLLSSKIIEQNNLIKTLIESFSKKLRNKKSTSTSGVASSDQAMSCTVDISSDSFNFNSQVFFWIDFPRKNLRHWSDRFMIIRPRMWPSHQAIVWPIKIWPKYLANQFCWPTTSSSPTTCVRHASFRSTPKSARWKSLKSIWLPAVPALVMVGINYTFFIDFNIVALNYCPLDQI